MVGRGWENVVYNRINADYLEQTFDRDMDPGDCASENQCVKSMMEKNYDLRRYQHCHEQTVIGSMNMKESDGEEGNKEHVF